MKQTVNSGLLLLMSIFCLQVLADENINNDKPSLEFLEFLGSFETENGQWLDPMEIQEMLKLTNQETQTQEKKDE